mgnify:CR=1 FL=1
MDLKFDEKGLIPAIVQDHYTKEVLTLAYMNAETLALTIAEGRTVFWSRSRQEIWRWYARSQTQGLRAAFPRLPHRCRELLFQRSVCFPGAEAVQLAGAV